MGLWGGGGGQLMDSSGNQSEHVHSGIFIQCNMATTPSLSTSSSSSLLPPSFPSLLLPPLSLLFSFPPSSLPPSQLTTGYGRSLPVNRYPGHGLYDVSADFGAEDGVGVKLQNQCSRSERYLASCAHSYAPSSIP